MTTDQPSPSLPTVQTRKRGGKLKPKACPPRRITYRSILKELKGKPKGKSICDIAVEGLRWRRSDNKGSIVAEYRYADSVSLGSSVARPWAACPVRRSLRLCTAARTRPRSG